jgi:ABC-2 type transport system permease protein
MAGTTVPATTQQPPAAHPAPRNVTAITQFGRAVAAEWTKLRSVRSTVWCLLATVVMVIGLPALFAVGVVASWDRMQPQDKASFDALGLALPGPYLGQLIIGALGVLLISAEYSTGTIRATLSAVPQRRPVLAAKVVVFAVVVYVVSTVACFVSFWLSQAILSQKHIGVSLSDSTALRVVFGSTLFLTAVGLFGVGLGTILRHSAGAISMLVGILLIIPILIQFLPSSWRDHIQRYLPDEAAGALIRFRADNANLLSPWVGFALFCGYVLLTLIIGGILLTRRDA